MPLTSPETANLVAALLTVNQYRLDKAFALMPAFSERGLLDPTRVAALAQPQLIAAMADAGYARGGFLPILSFRLYALMERIADGTLDALPALVAAGDKTTFADRLSAVPGFGPRTAEVAWELFTAR